MDSTITDLAFERLRRLDPHPTDAFEVAIVRMAQWVTGEPREPYRPIMAVAVSVERGQADVGRIVPPEETDLVRPLEAIANLATRFVGYRPAKVRVREEELADALRGDLNELGIAVELATDLPVVDEFTADMRLNLSPEGRSVGYLEVRGVTLERVWAFAEAAAEFHRAAPWNQLSDEDLIRIASPIPSRGFSHVVVVGAIGEAHGLSFHPSTKDHADFAGDEDDRERVLSRARWGLAFEPLHHLPFADSDLWMDHPLPLAGPRAYPDVVRFNAPSGSGRPNPGQMSFLEALLRALATTTEDEMDSGRWEKRVRTFDGERTVLLELPGVLQPPRTRPRMADLRWMERSMVDLDRAIKDKGLKPDEVNAYIAASGGRIEHPAAVTPRDRADDKCNEALTATGRLRLKLAREAIALWPGHVDARVLLAEAMPDPARALELWRQAFEVAERDLGPEMMRRWRGHFWGVLETRPYMRARAGLAGALFAQGDRDAAMRHWREMLLLNPGDNQGLRMLLIPALLETAREPEASEVLAEYAEDESAVLAYARALLEFRRGGSSIAARNELERALRRNSHALKYLLGSADPSLVKRDGSYSPGDEREAVIVAEALGTAFKATIGAVAWLRECRRERKKALDVKRSRRR